MEAGSQIEAEAQGHGVWRTTQMYSKYATNWLANCTSFAVSFKLKAIVFLKKIEKGSCKNVQSGREAN